MSSTVCSTQLRTVRSSNTDRRVGDWRLVDDFDVARTGAQEMRTDLELFERARGAGEAWLRIYRFHTPTLTLGRFQSEHDVDADAAARLGVEIVRRPTGGQALLHGAEVTYAVALPRPPGAAGSVDSLYCELARALIAGLATLGVTATVAAQPATPSTGVCFTGVQGADLRVDGRKVSGSAQLQREGWVLQHGSVLVDRLAFDETDLLHFATPTERAATRATLRSKTVTLAELGVGEPPREVADAVIEGFRSTSMNLRPAPHVEG